MDANLSLKEYRRLFVHRSDTFARQNPDRSYTPVRRELTDADLATHLSGGQSLGVYVIEPAYRPVPGQQLGYENTVSYIVFDLDTYDLDALDFLCAEVERLVAPATFQWWGPTAGGREKGCLLLEDSGGHGFHVWLFLSEPIPAARARAWAGLAGRKYAAENAGGDVFGLYRWPTLEIFPKQDTVPLGGFGNLVKLPLGIHAWSGSRSRFVARPGWAGGFAEVTPYPVGLVPEYAPKAASGVARNGGSGPGGDSSAPTRFACVNRILSEGAEAGTRDVAMLHLSHYARGCGVPREIAVEWCLAENGEWADPLPEAQVRTKVASAYRMEAPHPSCRQDWLRDFCPGSETMRTCPNYQGRNEAPSAGSSGMEWS